MTGTGEGTSGFAAAIPAGPAFPLGGFSDPFSIVTNALGTVNVGGEIEALEFAPQSPPSAVPEPGTWAMMLLRASLASAFVGYRKTVKARLAA